MKRKFNVSGTCFPEMHYMADVTGKMGDIYELIEQGEYFIINRPRQYGKTTTLQTITNYYKKSNNYLVYRISFEGIGDDIFNNEKTFSAAFLRRLANYAGYAVPKMAKWLTETSSQVDDLETLSNVLTALNQKTKKKMILLIDEVDKRVIINCL